MSVSRLKVVFEKRVVLIHCVLLVGACFAIYANSFDHGYNLDST